MIAAGGPRSAAWKWYVCGLLLLATMLNYMDRQTLAQTKTRIEKDPDVRLTDDQYGTLEFAFGVAFAAGGILIGLVVDRASIRWIYPAVLLGWSTAGFATAYAGQIGRLLSAAGLATSHRADFWGLVVCRVALGFFAAGQWPCALATSQRLLPQEDRTLGNSILQSGASLGAILTPLVVQLLVGNDPAGWRWPFLVIGALGVLWVGPWLAMIREQDLALSRPSGGAGESMTGPAQPAHAPAAPGPQAPEAPERAGTRDFWRRLGVLALVVILINMCWHFYRAWLPSFLEKYLGYSFSTAAYLTSAYYTATALGCILFGLASKRLATRGWGVHWARMATCWASAALTALSAVAAVLPAGPALVGVLLLIGFGGLGLFANYYSFTQELSQRHQGKLVGTLGCLTWCFTAGMQKVVGHTIERSQSNYPLVMFVVGLGPLAACGAIWLFWNRPSGGAGPRESALFRRFFF